MSPKADSIEAFQVATNRPSLTRSIFFNVKLPPSPIEFVKCKSSIFFIVWFHFLFVSFVVIMHVKKILVAVRLVCSYDRFTPIDNS